LIHDIPEAAEIVDRIVSQAEEILFGRRNSSAALQSKEIYPNTLIT